MSQIDLPFEVGHIIEARSFELGFRGAWFRCKVLLIFLSVSASKEDSSLCSFLLSDYKDIQQRESIILRFGVS